MDTNTLLLSTNFQVKSPGTGRYFLADITFLPTNKKKPVVIFAHGFKGFKDWGPYNAMARYFASQGFVFIKFNFSHNGVTLKDPIDFADLEAFGNDNHSTQLADITAVLNYIAAEGTPLPPEELDLQRVSLIGHSRGGSLVLLKAAEEPRIHKVVTWAAVSDLLASYSAEALTDWKTSGVRWVANTRTKQSMPVYYQYYEDLIINAQRLDVLKASASLKQPLLLIHAENDETVPLSNAQSIHQHALHSELLIIKGANHTFGGTHPFTANTLPETLQQLYNTTIQFLQ